MSFDDVAVHRPAAEALFAAVRRDVLALCPRAAVEHVGSTALAEGLTKGDLDVQVRVSAADYDPLRRALARRYALNEGAFAADDAVSFSDARTSPELGLHVTVIGGSGDFQHHIRDVLNERPDLNDEYDAIKRRAHGGSMDAYRQAKHAFCQRLMRSDDYLRRVASHGWQYRPLVLRSERLCLLSPMDGDAGRLAEYAARNQAHLARWEPARPDDYRTEAHWRRVIELEARDTAAGRSLLLFAVGGADLWGQVLAVCRFSNIVRGPFQACNLGYSVDAAHEGRGVMTETLAAAIAFAFGDMALHRIMAGYMPGNERSGRLLRKLGFTVEGYARDYLFIDGRWRDHILTSLSNPAPIGPAGDRR